MWRDLSSGIVESEYRYNGNLIIQTNFDVVMNENPQSCWDFTVVPIQETEMPLENDICPHPNWGWLAVNRQGSVSAFRRRQQARRFVNS